MNKRKDPRAETRSPTTAQRNGGYNTQQSISFKTIKPNNKEGRGKRGRKNQGGSSNSEQGR